MKRKKTKTACAGLGVRIKAVSRKQVSAESFDFKSNLVKMRLRKKLSGAELCRRAGDLDPRTLTALEKGRIENPSIKSLRSLARGLGVPLAELFRDTDGGSESLCVQGTQKGVYRMEIPSWGVKIVSYVPFIHDFFCGKFILAAQKRLTGEMLKHPFPVYRSGLVGRIEAEVEGKKCLLREGDNLFFNGILKHSIYNPWHGESAFWLVTAPSFL